MILTFDSNPILFDAWSSFFEVIGYFDRSVYVALGDKKQAKAYFEAAYQIFFKFFGPDHLSTRTTAKWLSNLREV